MDLKEFSEQFENNPSLRTQYVAALSTKLADANLSLPLKFAKTPAGSISLTVGPDSDDLLLQLRAADAAVDVLKKYGVENLEDLRPLDPETDPRAWNIVYKDGGWVINS